MTVRDCAVAALSPVLPPVRLQFSAAALRPQSAPAARGRGGVPARLRPAALLAPRVPARLAGREGERGVPVTRAAGEERCACPPAGCLDAEAEGRRTGGRLLRSRGAGRPG